MASVKVHPAYLLTATALAAIIAAGIAGAALYPSLPDPVPTHWNAAGQVDAWSAKSFWSVFGTLVIAAGIVGILFASSYFSAPGESRAQRHLLVTSLGCLQVSLGAGLAALALCTWLAPGVALPFYLVLAAMIAGILATLVVLGVRLARGAASRTESDSATDAPAPEWAGDPHWRAGFLYVNAADGRVVVPKRYGLGWTINFGSAGGIAIGALVIAVIAAAVVLPALRH